MIVSLSAEGVRAVLLDIEGTTTPVEFVYGTLFPYARDRAAAYLAREIDSPDLAGTLERLRADHAADRAAGASPPPLADDPPSRRVESLAAYVAWLIDRDRKATGLKELQGRIWQDGYRRGDLRGVVFPDVPRALARWRRAGIAAHIFSSGSVLAQQLLFSTVESGDLTPFITRYFDTTTGPKTRAESYARIATRCEQPPARMLFVSDVAAELDAAADAEMKTLMARRPGNAPPTDSTPHRVVSTFDDIDA